MSQTHVVARLEGSVGHLTLSNPKKFNALPQSGWASVAPKVSELVDQGARVLIISGAGDNFCAGADISEFDVVRKNEQTARVYEATNVDAFGALRNSPVPTIAKIRGYCLGGGFGLAAACDLRLATEDAQFAVPAAKLGLGYPVDALADIVEAVGTQNAKQLMFTADRLSSQQMKEMGFLLSICGHDELESSVEALALKIANLAPLTHRATKATILAMRSGDWHGAKSLSDATFASEDYAEGRRAFREKRAPRFTGS